MTIHEETGRQSFYIEDEWGTSYAQISFYADGSARVANCCDSERLEVSELIALRDWLNERLAIPVA